MERLLKNMKAAQALIAAKDAKVFPLLKKMGREMLDVSDHSMNGRFFYLRALAEYHFDRPGKFYAYLQSAVRHLLRSEDHLFLARAYNLFAVNAKHAGLHDVAYNYFLLAYSFVEEDTEAIESVLVNANLGDLLAEMGDYKKACGRIRKSLPLLKKHRGVPFYFDYLSTLTVNLGLYSLYAGEIEKAGRILKKAKRQIEAAGEAAQEDTAAWLLLFDAQFAFIGEVRKNRYELLDEVIRRIVKTPLFSQHMHDVYRFCRTLMDSGEEEAADRLIDASARNIPAEAPADAKIRLMRLQIDYYKAGHQRRKLKESYLLRRDMTRMAEHERRVVYRESVRLMTVAEELRTEQEAERDENRRLRARAEQDALTGLPNRLALNRVLEQSFASAKEKNGSFGVGIIDIDFFKHYNDRFGHQKGDECLRLVANVIRDTATRYQVSCFRYGGDEFVLVYGDLERHHILRFEREVKEALPVRVSHGFHIDRAKHGTRVWDFLSRADENMYSEKKKPG